MASLKVVQPPRKNSQDICNLFATFFQETYSTFSDNDRDFEYFTYFLELSGNFGVTQIFSEEIWSGLNNLDVTKGSGPDGIPPLF